MQIGLTTSRIVLLLAMSVIAIPICTDGALARDEVDPPVKVAVVIELSGKAETQVEGRPTPVSILSEFGSRARARLHKDAIALVLFYRTGEQYAITGPSLIRFNETGLEALTGNEPIKKPTLLGKDGRTIAVRAVGVAQAGIVVRGSNRPLLVLNPVGNMTLEERPSFRWHEVEPGLEYRLILRDSTEKILVDRTVRGGSLELPSEIVLGEGQRYRWSLFSKAPDGASYAMTHRFSVADRKTRSDVENFRPNVDAGVGERIVFALWLEQIGLKDEAARCWGEIAASGVSLPPDKADIGK